MLPYFGLPVIRIHPTVGAALIVLAGTVVTLWLNRVEQRRQQLIDLRRDVYLSASDTLASLLEALNTLTDRSVPLSKLSELMQRFAGHVGKLHLLGNSETVAAVIAFQRIYLEQYFRRIRQKIRLDVTVADQQGVIQEFARLQERRFALARFWEAIRIQSQGMSPQQIGERLRIVQQEQEAINHAAGGLDSRQRDLESLSQELEMQLFRMSPEIARVLNPPLVALILLLRRELGLPSNEQAYVADMTSLTEFADAQLRSFIEDYQEFLREREQRSRVSGGEAEGQTPLGL